MKVLIITILLSALLLIDSVTTQQLGSFGFGFRSRPGGFGRAPGGFYRESGFMIGNNRGVPANCPSICPAIYMPTCGFNGICYRSFSNSCELSSAACTGQGNFQQVPVSECSRPGTRQC